MFGRCALRLRECIHFARRRRVFFTAQRCGIRRACRSQLHMTHELAGQPSCKSSRTSSPHCRITSNHRYAMAPNPPACCFIHASMAGSRSTAPLNRRNCALIVATVFALEICSYVAFLLPSSAPASVLGPWSPPARAGVRPTRRHWITSESRVCQRQPICYLRGLREAICHRLPHASFTMALLSP
jgi:hypothetical protein